MKKMVMVALVGMSLISGTSFGFWCTDAAVENELQLYSYLEQLIKGYILGPVKDDPSLEIALSLKKSKHPEVIFSMENNYANQIKKEIDFALSSDGVYAYQMPSGETVVVKEKGRLQQLSNKANIITKLFQEGLKRLFTRLPELQAEQQKKFAEQQK